MYALNPSSGAGILGLKLNLSPLADWGRVFWEEWTRQELEDHGQTDGIYLNGSLSD